MDLLRTGDLIIITTDFVLTDPRFRKLFDFKIRKNMQMKIFINK